MPRTAEGQRKKSITITIDPALYDWIEARVGTGKPFANVSHAIESGVAALQRDEEEEVLSVELMRYVVETIKKARETGDESAVRSAVSALRGEMKATSARSRSSKSEK